MLIAWLKNILIMCTRLMKKITFVTKNKNKLNDAQKLLADFKVQNVDFDAPEIQSLNPREIIEEKLRFAFERVKEPCFVMDASLFFNCLNGFPGPFIRFWFEDTVGAEKTCEIANLFKDYGCRFVNVLGYFDGDDIHFFEETIEGEIPNKPRGDNGYHWDVIFVPKGEAKTFAEMTFAEKHKYAPQAKLFKRLSDFLSAEKKGVL